MVVLDACRDNPFKAVSRSATRGLRMIDAGGGSVIAASVFTKTLLEHLTDPVDVRTLFHRVADAVRISS